MGLSVQERIGRSIRRMTAAGMTDEDAEVIANDLFGAGIDHCLDEQDRVRREQEALVSKAYEGLVH